MLFECEVHKKAADHYKKKKQNTHEWWFEIFLWFECEKWNGVGVSRNASLKGYFL